LAKAEEIAEFNAAIAYAGCRKTAYKNSLVLLSGGNVAVSDL
jgi:threonine dehydratase